ncbi:MAG: hypothetical protein HZC55_04285 [Verrucomicrobia bacterium]|nr:hypothetical protein [Verrucomicrobiota bacterium]
MTPAERSVYFGQLWPEACLANEWLVKDEERRRAVTAECMRLVRGPDTDSTSALGPDEVTALFTYLRHLADPSSLDKSARWVTCQEDYRTFNRARQADYHERALYGGKKNRLDRDRFGGATSAAGGPLESLDADEVRKRHLTMASRHQKKQRVDRKVAAMIEVPVPASPPPAAPTRCQAPTVDVPF